MLLKGTLVQLWYTDDHGRVMLPAEVLSATPITLRVTEGDVSEIAKNLDQKVLVDIRDAQESEIIMTAVAEKADAEKGILILKRLGQNELRASVRVSAWLDMSMEVIEGDPSEALDRAGEIQMGALPEFNFSLLQTLARREENGELWIYLAQAMETINRKLDAVLTLQKQAMVRVQAAKMSRHRVSISGSGIRFDEKTGYDPKTLLLIKAKIPQPIPNEVVFVAEVVRAEKVIPKDADGTHFSVACRYVRITEGDRERIISFTVFKQRELLRRMHSGPERF